MAKSRNRRPLKKLRTSRIIMMRKKNIYGSCMQGIGGGKMVKSVGQQRDVNGPDPA